MVSLDIILHRKGWIYKSAAMLVVDLSLLVLQTRSDIQSIAASLNWAWSRTCNWRWLGSGHLPEPTNIIPGLDQTRDTASLHLQIPLPKNLNSKRMLLSRPEIRAVQRKEKKRQPWFVKFLIAKLVPEQISIYARFYDTRKGDFMAGNISRRKRINGRCLRPRFQKNLNSKDCFDTFWYQGRVPRKWSIQKWRII